MKECGENERSIWISSDPGAKPLLNEGRQQIITTVCGNPPARQGRWTAWLIDRKLVNRGLVEQMRQKNIGLLFAKLWRSLAGKEMRRWQGGLGIHRAHESCTDHVMKDGVMVLKTDSYFVWNSPCLRTSPSRVKIWYS